ncbi:zinc-binding dehydrogenase [Tetragenococcus koreensis]|uniref:zinc-binding dehydrogenase n=1 Tax=Tetragenococcus koreensis TaxID=290335 RepID=UPI001F326979|nr:zinc-binding dehydrogenase [Tetragenococcus koreensis]MCF1585581.1 zinc-binding dehydrogenase [Tetragenococcus koreensis]MCF1615127.1 zinc-binding dehydrogenase [Tetragenococcus koreensis]MCF1619578.1 zinc-binding dehydrogenase [Tetragenococcus koreensis]MCF1624955.1 zinc-binding dehydrogenase [Tetragenococcus koreensis]MCF1629847.1 zinc-binding dehydrogenase [Tetragenococcus koreensis]
MKAVTITENNEIAVKQREAPQVSVGEVLVKIHAAGMNNADVMQKMGGYPAPVDAPADIPGLEFAGKVVEIGPETERFSVGDRVMGLVSGGAQAEIIAVNERFLMPMPRSLSWEAAGSFPEAFITAHDALSTKGNLRPGERVLITGAAGAVGVAAVQFAKSIGAEVIASVRNPDTREATKKLGADGVIAPADMENYGPYDVILELIGAADFAANIDALNYQGRIICIGFMSGADANVDISKLAFKQAAVYGRALRKRPKEGKATAIRAVEKEVLSFVEKGEMIVPLHATYSLDDAEEAYENYNKKGKFGQIVLVNE